MKGRRQRRALAPIAGLLTVVLAGCGPTAPPTIPGAPRYPEYAKPEIPASLTVSMETRTAFDDGWTRLQAGDVTGANRAFAMLLRNMPAFYPAETGLGFTFLAARQYKQASLSFTNALSRDARYVPALEGLATAQIELRDETGAMATLRHAIAVDPTRDALRSRLDVLRLRVVQAQLQAAHQARDAGNLEEAQRILERLLDAAPLTPIVLRELAAVETERKSVESAETHARKAVELDPDDAEAQAVLGGVLEARARDVEAAAAYGRAAALDPRPAWRDKAEALRERARTAAIPAEYRAIPSAATITRAQVAAMIGLRLSDLVARAPRRATQVITDTRDSWAALWISDVVQTGFMEALPNHTFQPEGVVRRADLAAILARILPLAAARRADELARWKAARPRFADLAQTHLSYPAAALAVASGTMRVLDGDRFAATRNLSGAELVAAMARLEQITGLPR